MPRGISRISETAAAGESWSGQCGETFLRGELGQLLGLPDFSKLSPLRVEGDSIRRVLCNYPPKRPLNCDSRHLRTAQTPPIITHTLRRCLFHCTVCVKRMKLKLMFDRRVNVAIYTSAPIAGVSAIFGAALVLLLLPRVPQAGTLTTTLQVSARVVATCNRSAASELHFGAMAVSQRVASSNTVLINCDRDTPYTVTCESREHQRCATRVECFHQPNNSESRDRMSNNTGIKPEAAHADFHECVSIKPQGPHADPQADHTAYMALISTRESADTARAAGHVDIVTLTLTY